MEHPKGALLIVFICLLSQLHVFAQSQYLMKDKDGLNFVLNIKIEGNMVSGFTREEALLDYTSKFNYNLIKFASSLKYPEVIRFNATVNDGQFEGTYNNLFSAYKIMGKISGDSISYTLYNNRNKRVNSLNGIKLINYAKKDYHKLAEDIIKITEDNIYDPTISRSKSWMKFKEKFLSASSKTSDDLEFQVGFYTLTQKIGFSHYYLTKNTPSESNESAKSTLIEVDSNTVFLKIRSFSEKRESLKPLLDSILRKGYSTLVVDIRDNPGGNFSSIDLVANFLSKEDFVSGFFPNRNWYLEYNRLPNKNDIDKFTLMDKDTQPDPKYGFYAQTKVSDFSFKGKTYLLINKNTGSSAEVLAIGAKEYGLATIVGQTTAGALLKIKRFNIDKDIALILPAYDFISFKGTRVDQKGVKPDIEAKQGHEWETVKSILQKQ